MLATTMWYNQSSTMAKSPAASDIRRFLCSPPLRTPESAAHVADNAHNYTPAHAVSFQAHLDDTLSAVAATQDAAPIIHSTTKKRNKRVMTTSDSEAEKAISANQPSSATINPSAANTVIISPSVMVRINVDSDSSDSMYVALPQPHVPVVEAAESPSNAATIRTEGVRPQQKSKITKRNRKLLAPARVRAAPRGSAQSSRTDPDGRVARHPAQRHVPKITVSTTAH